MIDIGRACARFWNLEDRVRLDAIRFQAYTPTKQYSVVFAFAAHRTDDKELRLAFDTHMNKLHGFVAEGGLLIFESHCEDVGKPEFYEGMERQRHLFSWDGSKVMFERERELFVMRRR